MTANLILKSNFYVSFKPSIQQVEEIEKWLIAERNKNGEGFYCNWEIIKSSYEKNELATISLKKETLGFATWRVTSDMTATIDIVEVKSSHRKKGIGRILIQQVFDLFRHRNISAIDLQCAPSASEPIWKRLGFKDVPNNSDSSRFNGEGNKKLYYILTSCLEPTLQPKAEETIELWNCEPYQAKDNRPTWIWNLQFKNKERELIKPIIHPGHSDWRLRWSTNYRTIKDCKVKYFGTEISFSEFVIITQMPQ